MSRWTVGFVLVLAALIAVGGLVMSKSWSAKAQEEPRGNDKRQAKPAADEFASERRPGDSPVLPFNAKRAMGYLEELCKIGPRMSGSEGMKKQQEMLKKHFETHGGRVEFQRFTAHQKSQGASSVEMANLIVSWHLDRPRRVILCSHYDTRPIADQEPDRRRWHDTFVSANDGGSGVALLMEMAPQMKDLKADVGIDFVFFDGEEYIFDPAPGGDKYFFGSEYFGTTYVKSKPRFRYVGAILLDMVGGKDVHIPVEPNSMIMAGSLLEQVWKIAEELKCDAFEKRMGKEAYDDHLALNKAHIPAIDLIDFDYPHWHRLSDVPANCSADSLEQVARVLGVWLQRVK